MDYAETSGTKETVKVLHSAALVSKGVVVHMLDTQCGSHELVVNSNGKFCFEHLNCWYDLLQGSCGLYSCESVHRVTDVCSLWHVKFTNGVNFNCRATCCPLAKFVYLSFQCCDGLLNEL